MAFRGSATERPIQGQLFGWDKKALRTRILTRRTARWSLIGLLLGLLLGIPASSEVVDLTGGDGASGADGAPTEQGQQGGDGETVSAEASSPSDLANRATVTGGSGGDGGAGGDGLNPLSSPFLNGQPGGAGGAGGDAAATAVRGTDLSQFGSASEAVARGGDGGAGGEPGNPDPNAPGDIGRTGVGGRGGDALAEGVDGPGSAAGRVEADSVGGAGGQGFHGGDGGEGRARAEINSPPGSSSLSVDARGGDGGDGSNESLSSAGVGGLGHASGRLATSGPDSHSLFLEARGGNGGEMPDGEGQSGGDGGDARSEYDVSGSNTSVRAESQGGNGGFATGVGRAGGSGGSASFAGVSDLPAGSGSDARRTVSLSGTGGTGGVGIEGAVGGDGGSVALEAPTAEGDGGSLTVEQGATGGRGGGSSSTAGGISGSGGDASSQVNQTFAGTQLRLTSFAEGGDAGFGRGFDATSRGGDAMASVDGTNSAGFVNVQATAIGGAGADTDGNSGGSAGLAGDAVAMANGMSSSGGTSLTVSATALGGSGGDSDSGEASVAGSANAEANAISLADDRVTSEARASSQPSGRLTRSRFQTATADGRQGSDNTARASASNVGSSGVTATASAFGGVGSSAFGPGRRAGDGGVAIAEATSISQSGGVTAETTLGGGDGGTGLAGADGGSGASATAIDSVSGTSEGSIRLVQSVVGGEGGEGQSGGVAGVGGDATSILNVGRVGSGNLSLDVSAVAGAGGGSITRRAIAGDVQLGVTGEGEADVTIEAAANLGTGSNLTLDPIEGISTGDGDVFVRLEARGQADRTRGGSEDSGDGVDVTLENSVSGASEGGVLTLWQRAIAGSATGTDPGAAGDGGDADSRMSGVTRRPTIVNVDAYGGAGGDAPFHISVPDTVPVGRGGDANTEADYSTEEGDLTIHAGAHGGDGGDSFRLRPGGDGGDARVRADLIVGSSATRGARIGGSAPTRFSDPQVGAFGGDAEELGAGGDADSESRMTSFAVNNRERLEVFDRATGGSGGDRGGLGGNARSVAHLSAAGDEDLVVSAVATGGDGGIGGTAEARAHGESFTGDVSVSAIQIAGDGFESDSLEGGVRAGSDSLMGNAATGGTGGRLTLVQTAVAGSGSSRSTEMGDGGRGGLATSNLTEGNFGGGSLNAALSSEGGAGGRAVGAGFLAGGGGDAISTIDLRDVTESVRVELEAIGGAGGVTVDGGLPGQGGGASFGDSRITTEAELSIYVDAIARSGDGGSRDPRQGIRSFVGGHAQDVDLENSVAVETSGWTTIDQRAFGGDGGAGRGTGGNGGNARSVLRRLDRGSLAENLSVYAEGGAAGGSSEDRAGSAGDAHAEIEARSSTGSLRLKGEALGGTNGLSGISGPRDQAGDATVAIVASVLGDNGSITIGPLTSIDDAFGATGGAGRVETGSFFNSDHLETIGDGGNATSRSEGTAFGNSRVRIRDRAIGGEGGRVSSRTGVDAGVGGDAFSTAIGRGEGNANVEVTAEAIGGIGGLFDNPRAMGGTAEAVASGESTDGGEVSVTALQTGGTLQDSRMIDQVSGSTSGSLELVQTSTGGHGGASAISELTATNPGGGRLDARSEAIGGRGDGTRDQAGNANAVISGTDVVGALVSVSAIATAGDAFQQGPGGDSVAHAHAEGRGRVIASAQSTAGRPRGSVIENGGSLAHSSAIGVEFASATSELTRSGSHDGEAIATLRPDRGRLTEASALLRAQGRSQAGFGLRSEVFLQSVGPEPPPVFPTDDSHIQVGIADQPRSGGRLAEVDIVLVSESGASGWTQSAVIELAVGTALPASLVFGDWTGDDTTGIESIAIAISEGSETFVERVFTNVVFALAFLSGAEFDLGTERREGPIRASFEITSGEAGGRLMGGFALVVIPEPSTAVLLSLGLLGLGIRRR